MFNVKWHVLRLNLFHVSANLDLPNIKLTHWATLHVSERIIIIFIQK